MGRAVLADIFRRGPGILACWPLVSAQILISCVALGMLFTILKPYLHSSVLLRDTRFSTTNIN